MFAKMQWLALQRSLNTVECKSIEPPGKTKMVWKFGKFEKMGEITVVNSGEESDFGSSYQEVQNIDGSGNQDSIVKFKLTMDLSPSVWLYLCKLFMYLTISFQFLYL